MTTMKTCIIIVLYAVWQSHHRHHHYHSAMANVLEELTKRARITNKLVLTVSVPSPTQFHTKKLDVSNTNHEKNH